MQKYYLDNNAYEVNYKPNLLCFITDEKSIKNLGENLTKSLLNRELIKLWVNYAMECYITEKNEGASYLLMWKNLSVMLSKKASERTKLTALTGWRNSRRMQNNY